ncbi:unnamed protein product [Alternaria alternata]
MTSGLPLNINPFPADLASDGRTKYEHAKEDPHLIAEYLAQNSSKAAAIFRRYDKLAMCRLIQLSRKLRKFEREHEQLLARGADTELEEDEEDEEKVDSTIKEYYDLLIAYSKVLNLEPPAERTVEAIHRYITNPKLHYGYKNWQGHKLRYRVEGEEGETTFSDLASLYTPAENDYLSKFVDKFLYPLFLTPESNKDAKYVNEQKMQRFVTFVGTFISMGFLISAMWVLWRLKDDMIAKLATVTGFVVGFAAWLGFLTTAQRKDVIAATAAYAAVLVVFVSQQEPTKMG